MIFNSAYGSVTPFEPRIGSIPRAAIKNFLLEPSSKTQHTSACSNLPPIPPRGILPFWNQQAARKGG